ncbi:MAG: PPOX class F420-dependent oxidoreductase [Haloarculaceae archaeon]
MASIPEDFEDLFDRPSPTVFVTMQPNGIPHSTMVWVDRDGDTVLVNTANGTQKHRNVQRNPTVAVTVIDPETQYRYLTVQGDVTAITEEGGADHLNELGRRYLDSENYIDEYDANPDRRVLHVTPDNVLPVTAL